MEKDILGYEGSYTVNNNGDIKSLDRYVNSPRGGIRFKPGRILKQATDPLGYKIVCLSSGGCKHKNHKVHRLVAQAFIPNPGNKREVNHKNGIKADNRLENLEWVTTSENQKHAFAIGLSKGKSGKDNPMYGKRGVLSPVYKEGPRYPNGKKIYMKPKKEFNERCALLLDQQTGIFYTSIKEAAWVKDINYKTLVAMLSGQNKNRTSLIRV